MTGLSGAGKTTIATRTAEMLRELSYTVEVIDGDEYRRGLCSDLGFSKEDRNENIRRLSFVGKVLSRNDVVAIISAINPYAEVRKEIRNAIPNSALVYVNATIEEVIHRDTKGLYKKALLPDDNPEKINNFTGISDPYEEPASPELILDTCSETPEESSRKLCKFIIDTIEENTNEK